MSRFFTVLVGALFLTYAGWMIGGVRLANAADYYPWCARYGGGADSPGVPSCGFMTRQQCQASVSGTGGFCEQNWPQTPGSQRRR
jgi:hypothetical protein